LGCCDPNPLFPASAVRKARDIAPVRSPDRVVLLQESQGICIGPTDVIMFHFPTDSRLPCKGDPEAAWQGTSRVFSTVGGAHERQRTLDSDRDRVDHRVQRFLAQRVLGRRPFALSRPCTCASSEPKGRSSATSARFWTRVAETGAGSENPASPKIAGLEPLTEVLLSIWDMNAP
jgi:hypothetical protein